MCTSSEPTSSFFDSASPTMSAWAFTRSFPRRSVRNESTDCRSFAIFTSTTYAAHESYPSRAATSERRRIASSSRAMFSCPPLRWSLVNSSPPHPTPPVLNGVPELDAQSPQPIEQRAYPLTLLGRQLEPVAPVVPQFEL